MAATRSTAVIRLSMATSLDAAYFARRRADAAALEEALRGGFHVRRRVLREREPQDGAGQVARRIVPGEERQHLPGLEQQDGRIKPADLELRRLQAGEDLGV